jgi:hypothetical protein
MNNNTPFITLLHAHDYIWTTDWPLDIKSAACRILIQRFNPTVEVNHPRG